MCVNTFDVFPFFLGTFSFAALLVITSHDFTFIVRYSGDARGFLSLINLSLLRAPYMLNPLLIGGISRGLAVALAAPSSRAVRIHLTMHRCAPFILYFASAKYRLTVTPSNEIKDTSFPPPFPSLPLSFSFSWSRGRGIARAAPGKFLPLGLLLHSALFARGRATGGFSFYASHFLLSANFVFLSCPSLAPPVHGPPRGSSVALLSFFSPFLVASPRDPVTGDYATHNGEI